MIAVVRIAGQCKKKQKHIETLNRLNLGKKYTCALIDKKDAVRAGMVESVRDYVIYGDVSGETEKELKEKRGKKGKKVFFLHPPRGGFKKSTKLRYPEGILGKNPDIDKLIMRML